MRVSNPLLVGLALMITAGCGESSDAFAPPEPFRLIWSQEFDGDAGSSLDRSIWNIEIGRGPNNDGYGNNQLEFTTEQTDNVSLDGNGNLAITALRQDFAGQRYTSGRINTQDNFSHRYGRIEARIKLPVGLGIWPAFWMLGADFSQVGWPQTGEIDIMEYRGQDPQVVIGSVHGPGYSGGGAISRNFRLDSEQGFDADFHVFAVEWDPSRI
ncbi:MAG: glycoside hydrolase family 16 protein, partial [Myxococcota bacterium]